MPLETLSWHVLQSPWRHRHPGGGRRETFSAQVKAELSFTGELPRTPASLDAPGASPLTPRRRAGG